MAAVGSTESPTNADSLNGKPTRPEYCHALQYDPSPAAIEYLQGCVHGEHGPAAAIAAWRLIVERGYGKVPQQFEMRSALLELNFNLLDDATLSRIAGGEDLIQVLIGVVLAGGSSPAVEHLRSIVPAATYARG